MKKSLRIVIVFIVLTILIGTYSYIRLNPKQSEQVEETTTKERIQVITFNPEDIVKIELLSSERNLTLLKEENWIIEENKNMEANQSIINNITNTMSEINAELIVEENAKDLSIYGLDKANKIKITLADNNSYTFLMGNQVPTGEGNYFMQEGTNTVYMLGYGYKSSFNYTMSDLVQKEQIPTINSEGVSYLYIAQKGKPEIEISLMDENSDDKYEIWHSLSMWKITKPYEKPRSLGNNDNVMELLQSTSNFNSSIKNFVESNPTSLDKYGLDEPELELWVKDIEDSEVHLYFGNSAEDGGVYFKQANSNDIYTFSKSTVDKFMNIDTFSIIDRFCLIFNIDSIKKVVINKDNKTTTFDVTNTVEVDEDGYEDTITSCTVDGKEYPEEDFQKLYQNFIGIMVDSEYKGEKLTGKPDISMTLELDNGKVFEAKYYKYDDKYYVFDKNGTQEFLVSKRQFENMSERMNEFFNGTISEK